ncbi:hypothetical protein DOTSEDRAFT_79009 [Dothistroma septosporum NZE10]|uniref:Protein kinase domain-containing protein n=1 Tax=Dothistroma septosporum (strain NZE10 / CBS 128990) TaxID=675120 RepID=N1PXF8_DOTSN|nr:hypothetical protein DOTSEDRAFT_79009 [Dothistroma septosporum NZE10]
MPRELETKSGSPKTVAIKNNGDDGDNDIDQSKGHGHGRAEDKPRNAGDAQQYTGSSGDVRPAEDPALDIDEPEKNTAEEDNAMNPEPEQPEAAGEEPAQLSQDPREPSQDAANDGAAEKLMAASSNELNGQSADEPDDEAGGPAPVESAGKSNDQPDNSSKQTSEDDSLRIPDPFVWSVAEGLARLGLGILNNPSGRQIVHRDLKPENVFLDRPSKTDTLTTPPLESVTSAKQF